MMKSNASLTLLALWKHHNGNWDDIYNKLKNKDASGLNEDKKWAEEHCNEYVTMYDSEYPQHLKNQYKAPFVLTNEECEEEKRLKKYAVHLTKTIYVEAHNSIEVIEAAAEEINDDSLEIESFEEVEE